MTIRAARYCGKAVYAACALALAVAFGCGGGGGSSSGSAAPVTGTFTPTTANPPSNSVTMQPGTSGTQFKVKIMVKDIPDFFGTAFTFTYPRTVVVSGITYTQLAFLAADSSNSFLNGSGIQTQFLLDETGTPGTVHGVCTRVQDAGGTVPGVNVGSTPTELVTLTFQAYRAMSAVPVAFTGNLEVCTSQLSGSPPVCTPVQGVTWNGGTVTAQ